jgi:hypothetical protein
MIRLICSNVILFLLCFVVGSIGVAMLACSEIVGTIGAGLFRMLKLIENVEATIRGKKQ